MGDVIDITHRLPAPEPTTDWPAATYRAAAYYGAICGAGSLAPVGETVHTPIRCHRRPKHRLCTGYIEVVRPIEQPGDVDWRCPSCGDNGTISGWRGSSHDLSVTSVSPSDPLDECTVYIDDEDYRVLQELLPLDPEIERVLLGGRRTDRAIRLTGSGLEMENLLGFLAFQANHEPRRRRQALFDQLCSRIEHALERPKTGLAKTISRVVARLLASDLKDQPPEAQRVMRYVWARVALDFGIFVLIGEEHVNGVDRLICALQEDGSSYVVERPPGWSLDDEARYVAPMKALLGGVLWLDSRYTSDPASRRSAW